MEPYFISKSKVFYGLSPPLGLLYLAKILENEGDTVTVLDFSAEPFNEKNLINAIHNIDVIGMTLLSPALEHAKHLIRVIKQSNPDIPLVIGGPHCTLLPQKALEETQADISIQGDGETVIKDIRQALIKKKEFNQIPGVSYKTKNGINNGPPVQLIDNLNTIPFPARHLVKRYTYGREFNPSYKPGDFTSIITSRGCPFSCRFCSRGSVSMRRYRMRSTDNVISELKEIQAQGYHHVAIADDSFPVTTKQAHALFDAIIQEQIDLKYSITATRVDLADKALFQKMKHAGVTHIQFGLESGNQDVLDYYHKQTTVETIRNAVELSHDIGFFTTGSFIFGAPFETKKHFDTTLSFALSLPLHSVSFLPLRYMIGSDLWEQAVSNGHITRDEYLVPADVNRGLGRFSKQELFSYCIKAQRAYYARPAFFINLLKTSLRNDDMTFMQSYISMMFPSIKK